MRIVWWPPRFCGRGVAWKRVASEGAVMQEANVKAALPKVDSWLFQIFSSSSVFSEDLQVIFQPQESTFGSASFMFCFCHYGAGSRGLHPWSPFPLRRAHPGPGPHSWGWALELRVTNYSLGSPRACNLLSLSLSRSLSFALSLSLSHSPSLSLSLSRSLSGASRDKLHEPSSEPLHIYVK